MTGIAGCGCGKRSRGSRAAQKRDEREPRHSIISSARSINFGGTSRPSAMDSTLDHLAKDRLHVCLRKRSQRLRANISERATAQSKRSHGNVIWCLDNRDDVVLA
jgi:hypothetical protein